MIDLYSWLTPNGEKVHIMLEECGLKYTAHPININVGEQFKQAFQKISANGRIPAIVDNQGPGRKPYALFESAAILMYLAEKSSKFWPKRTRARYDVMEWLMFQMANVGPMMGQAYHFRKYAPTKIPYAATRYTKEVNRLYGVMDKRLKSSRYLGGDAYTIADMANWPWVRIHKGAGVKIAEYPHVKRWIDAIGARPAVRRGMLVLDEYRHHEEGGEMSKETRKILYGKTQFKRR
jgi:GST-like protein